MRVLSRHDVEAALDMPRAIELMREAFVSLSRGRVAVPVRQAVPIPEVDATALLMPVHGPDVDRFGLKVVSVHPQNALRGLPTIHGLMLVVEASTGRALALMDAEGLTAIRTGAAVSALRA